MAGAPACSPGRPAARALGARARRVRRGLAAALLAAGVAGAWGGAGAEGRVDLETLSEPILLQLEAFRRGDFDAAYTFASAGIRARFDRAGFERMVRDGYPEIADSRVVFVAEGRQAPDGRVFIRVEVDGANGRRVEALYELVQEGQDWKINGVVTRPAREGARGPGAGYS